MVAKKHSYLTEQFLSIRAPNISFPYTFEAPTLISLGSTNYFCQSALTASNAADEQALEDEASVYRQYQSEGKFLNIGI